MNTADRYIATIYESCVDRHLDLTAIRHYLASHGIRRTPCQIVHDLDTAFCFTGYAASHPAPPVKTPAELDAELGP